MLSFRYTLRTASRSSRLLLSTSTRLREKPAPIKVTEQAANRVKEMIADKENCIGVMIGVKKRGCNGYSYTMNYAYPEDIDPKKYEIVDAFGLKVLVENKAVFYIVGTEMDFEETVLSSEFTFKNPNSKGKCGCGESFNV